MGLGLFAEGRHIDCIDGKGGLHFQEIDPATLRPLERVDYPREMTEQLRQIAEASQQSG